MRRMKMHGNDISDPRFRCFGCCHVKTGTLCLGFYHLMIQMVAISALLFAINRPEIFWDNDTMNGDSSNTAAAKINSKFVVRLDEDKDISRLPELPTPQPLKSAQPVDDGNYFYSKADIMVFTKKRLQSGDVHLALALLVGLFFVTLMLVHGVMKNRPGYLLPFFCFQLFDLILSCMTAIGHYTWLPNVQEMAANNPDLPFRDQLMDMNGQWMALCILLAYVIALFIKAYLVGVVWACYQYLHLRNASVLTYTMSEDGRRMEDGELLLPPDYESALKMPQVGAAPPPYGNA